jgi:hypothetical protein
MLPRRFWRYGEAFNALDRLSARQQWLALQSMTRFDRRHGGGYTIQFTLRASPDPETGIGEPS